MAEKSKDNSPEDRSEILTLVLAEHHILRDEILKRTELQHQFLSLALIVLGTLLSFGLQFRSSFIVLLYPVLSAFLAAVWAYNDRRVREIGDYIRVRIESRVGKNNIGWEHYRATIRRPRLGSLNFISSRGIFIGTSLLAILVAIPIAKYDVTGILLFIVAVIGMISSIITLRRVPVEVPAIDEKVQGELTV